MPLFGQLNVETRLAHLPKVPHVDTEAWELAGVECLQLSFEVGQEAADAVLPRAMHPAVPRYITFVVWKVPQSPVGSFHLVQLRLMARAGVFPRGYVLRAYTDAEAATQELQQRWGFPAATAEAITLRTHYDRVFASVRSAGKSILDIAMSHSEVVSGADIQYISSIHLAQVTGPTFSGPRLLQVDPKYTFHKAERGRPILNHLDEKAWNCENFMVMNAIVGNFATVDTDLPQIRFVMDTDIPVAQGTTKVH